MVGEFATIVGLMSAFQSGRKIDESVGSEEFMDWLSQHNHQDIRALIEQNQKTTVGVKAILNLGMENINTKLNTISEQLVSMSSRTEGLGDLADAFPISRLSDQALDIVKAMEHQKAENFIISRTLGPGPVRLVFSHGPNYMCEENRFLEDDLELLGKLELIRISYNPSGNEVYNATRESSLLVKSLS